MWPRRTLSAIWSKNASETSANSPSIHSWVSSVRFSCDHRHGKPVPYVKLTIRQTMRSHSRWVSRTERHERLGEQRSARRGPSEG